MNQGTQANINGNKAEKVLSDLLKSYGFYVCTYKEYITNPKKIKSFKYIAVSQFPYETVYDKAMKEIDPDYKPKSRFDYKLFNLENNKEAQIEIKEQQINGSADEKIPYCLENLYNSDADMGLLILIGNGFKKGAKVWAKSIIKSGKYKNGHCENVYCCDSFEEALEVIIDDFV